jgi:hypothetical protein
MATQDLVSWWPFLCLAVLFYGLLPRLMLLVAGIFTQNRALNGQDFNHSDCNRLIRRMKTPRVITKGHPMASANEVHSREAGVQSMENMDVPQGSHSNHVIALIPDDIYEDFLDKEFNGLILTTLGYEVQEKIRIGKDYETDKVLLDRLSQKQWGELVPAILILQEAWQPPIEETLKFIRNLRRTVGENASIEVALIGRPESESIFTPVKEEDWNTWKKRLTTMGDPFLGMERLVADES